MRISEEIGTAIASQDVAEFSAIINEFYRVFLSEDECREIFSKARSLGAKKVDADWGGWIVWVKSRIQPLIRFGSHQSAKERDVTATLHVFFFNIEESDEMLSRLKGEKPATSSTARSRITNYQSQLVPVDKTAANVSPKEFLESLV